MMAEAPIDPYSKLVLTLLNLSPSETSLTISLTNSESVHLQACQPSTTSIRPFLSSCYSRNGGNTKTDDGGAVESITTRLRLTRLTKLLARSRCCRRRCRRH